MGKGTSKQLKEMGETPDSIRRKKLYGPLFELSELNRPEGNIFDIYSSESNNIPSAKEINASELERYKNVYMHRGLQNQIFNEINSVQTQPVTNGFLKI